MKDWWNGLSETWRRRLMVIGVGWAGLVIFNFTVGWMLRHGSVASAAVMGLAIASCTYVIGYAVHRGGR